MKKLSQIRPNKTWIVLGVALTVGLVAALIARSYLSKQMQEIEARGKTEYGQVLAFTRSMKAGEVITSEDMAGRSVPMDYIHSGAFAVGRSKEFVGRTVATSLRAGDPVLDAYLRDKKQPTFSTNVVKGKRAVTLPVDEISSISGLLEPEDTIDLLVTLTQKGKKIIVPLLQGVRVLATGQRVMNDPQTGAKKQYSTVTLDASTEESRNLIIARDAGKITALLRNPDDPLPAVRSPVNLAALLAADKPTAVNDRGIPVLYGGSKFTEEESALAQPQLRNRGPQAQAVTVLGAAEPADKTDKTALGKTAEALAAAAAKANVPSVEFLSPTAKNAKAETSGAAPGAPPGAPPGTAPEGTRSTTPLPRP
jgi:pilus assembly protein CpaB